VSYVNRSLPDADLDAFVDALATHVDELTVYDFSNPVVRISFDFNVDSLSCCFAQTFSYVPDLAQILQNLTTDSFDVIVFDEFQLSDATTAGACEIAIAKIAELRGDVKKIVISGDSSGTQRRTSSGGGSQVPVSDWDLVQSTFRKSGLPFTVVKFSSNESLKEKVNRCNSFLKPASGRTRVRIHPADLDKLIEANKY
jgi:hypothetical protein